MTANDPAGEFASFILRGLAAPAPSLPAVPSLLTGAEALVGLAGAKEGADDQTPTPFPDLGQGARGPIRTANPATEFAKILDDALLYR